MNKYTIRILFILSVILIILLFYTLYMFKYTNSNSNTIHRKPITNKIQIIHNLKNHLKILTIDIGERSVLIPNNIKKTEQYIKSFYDKIGVHYKTEPYKYNKNQYANIVANISLKSKSNKNYIVGAHYDSVAGTVGADDNASAVAVQLELARFLNKFNINISNSKKINIKFISFPLEEPPVFNTKYMGSKISAKIAKNNNQKIDGMICLEMVGFFCHEKGCQKYPFPLNYLGYPKTGNYIGIVGDTSSSSLTNSIYKAFKKNNNLPVIKLSVPARGFLLPSVRLSDHASYWDQGYKAVMITDTAFFRNYNYHLSSDTMETLDYTYMAELVESLVLFFISQ